MSGIAMAEPQLSATLRRLEGVTDGRQGGVLLTTPSGLQLAAYWSESAPIVDTLATAKQCATDLVQHLIAKHGGADVDRINWVSVVAAVQRIVQEWNAARRDALYLEQPAAPITIQ
jgi:hypothetical protein